MRNGRGRKPSGRNGQTVTVYLDPQKVDQLMWELGVDTWSEAIRIAIDKTLEELENDKSERVARAV